MVLRESKINSVDEIVIGSFTCCCPSTIRHIASPLCELIEEKGRKCPNRGRTQLDHQYYYYGPNRREKPISPRRLFSDAAAAVCAHVYLLRLIIIFIINSLVAFLRRPQPTTLLHLDIIVVVCCTIPAMELINKFAVILPKMSGEFRFASPHNQMGGDPLPIPPSLPLSIP